MAEYFLSTQYVRLGVSAVGLVGCAPRFVPNRGHPV